MLAIKPINEITPAMRNALGEEGAERIRRFMETKDGWDFGRGKRFSKVSLAVLERFLQQNPPLPSKVFEYLTANGNVQLEWTDEKGEDFEIEFFPDRFEYYFTATGEEGAFGLDEVNLLVRKIERVARGHAADE